jgi:rubrerythrin
MAIRKKSKTCDQIKQNIHEEGEAIADYVKGAKKVDAKTAKLFRHIVKQERHHRQELKKRLKDVKAKEKK